MGALLLALRPSVPNFTTFLYSWGGTVDKETFCISSYRDIRMQRRPVFIVTERSVLRMCPPAVASACVSNRASEIRRYDK